MLQRANARLFSCMCKDLGERANMAAALPANLARRNLRYLAIVLSRLDDFANACSAYEKSIEMESDHMFHLNFAITLFNHGDLKEAKRQFLLFDELSAGELLGRRTVERSARRTHKEKESSQTLRSSPSTLA